jgi:1,5-anhydro-D-fructose reductase (1,5-anhydro-D-mannitol-forming)
MTGRQLRWVVVGVGDIATRRVIPAIQAEPHSELLGVVTRTPAKAGRYGVRAWTALEQALAEPEADSVYIATPVSLHAPQSIAALRAGKHVLCEKPVGLNYAEASAMEAVARESGRLLGVAYYRRTYPKVQRARQLMTEGAIGRPVLAEINCHMWFDDIDGPRGWLLRPAMSGGGPLYDIASHRIDLLNYLFGRPVRVSGHLSKAVHRREVEDCATVLIDYDSGVRGLVDVRWHSRVERDEFRITGTGGAICLTPLNGTAFSWPGGEEEIPNHSNLHYPCIENFVDAVNGHGELLSSIETARWTDWVTEEVVRTNVL